MDREGYEYHLTIINVKMKVKFPCKMKIEHMGSLLTGETSPSEDNRYIFNQNIQLKDSNRQCLELTVNLLTDKGAKYIAGVVKLYHSQIVRSEGQKIVLSLTKCIDPQAFCQIRIDQVLGKKIVNAPYDRKSQLQRDVPMRRDKIETDFSPHSAIKGRIMESKSEYQFPLNPTRNRLQPQWDSKSRNMPQTVYQKSRVAARPAAMMQSVPLGWQREGSLHREKLMQAQVYRQGYEKLRQKLKRQTQTNKQQLSKRLVLQNSENNLKLQVMRLKLRVQQNDKNLLDKNSKVKQLQLQVSSLQVKQNENVYLRQDISKKDSTIRILQQKVNVLTHNIQELKEMSDQRTANESNKIKELQHEISNLTNKYEHKQRQLQKQVRMKTENIHQKQLQLLSKTDQLQRNKKIITDLQKNIQNKEYQMEKILQNTTNNLKFKIEEQKNKIEHYQKELFRYEQEKKDQHKDIEQLKSTIIRMDYQKKISTQELETLRVQINQIRSFKQKYSEITRQNRTIIQERTHLERQLERTVQSKEHNISQINKQFQDQLEYYKRINRQFDQKNKNLSNKILEIEGQLDISRSQQDKLRRNLESSIKEISDSKQKQKNARKNLKNKQQEMLTMQTELATLKQKLKNVDQIYKLQVDKHREEIDKIKIQLQNQIDKNQELQDNNSQLSMELSKVKIKLQFSQEKSEKDSMSLRDKQAQVEGLIKDYEEQITGLDQTVNTLRNSEKQLGSKLQKTEMELIKAEEKNQRFKKDIKILEEKINGIDSALKVKTGEGQSLKGQVETLQQTIRDLQQKLSLQKTENMTVVSEKSKLQKMYQLSQEEIKRLKNDVTSSVSFSGQRQKQLEETRSILKTQKDQRVKLELQISNYKKEVQRHRDNLFDVIQKSLFTLPLGLKDDSRKNVDLLLQKPKENTFGEYINIISTHSKEIKQTLLKQIDLVKQLEREKQRLQEEISSSGNKYQSTEITLKHQIEELETEMQHIIEEKQAEQTDHSHALEQMDHKIKQFQEIVEQLHSQIQELNFTNSSIKMDYEVANEQNIKKINTLKKNITDLQEKVEYQIAIIGELQQKITSLQNNAQILQQNLDSQTQMGLRKERTIQEQTQILTANEKLIEELKRSKKELIQKISQLQLYLQTERQLNQKNKSLLTQEEGKSNQLKDFISNMMKQKEAAIKSDLERSQTIITLETSLHQTAKELELALEDAQRHLNALEVQKESNKKLQSALKEIQNEKKDEKIKAVKVLQALRDKEREMLNKDETIKKLELKLEKAIEKLKLETKELQQELEQKSNQNMQQARDSSQRLFQLQTQLQKKNSQISQLQNKIQSLQQQLFNERQKILRVEQELNISKITSEQLRAKINEMDSNLNEITDEAKLKQEQLFNFSGKNYNLQMKLQSRQRQFQQTIEDINMQWSNKYDSMCQEYQQRIQLIEKERDYFKNINDDKDKEISKINQALRQTQNSQNNVRRTLEAKVRALEEDRIGLISTKNGQLQRNVEEVKVQSQLLKQREAQLRKVSNQLQIARKTITNLDQKAREEVQKAKGTNRLYQTEMEQLKKREVAFKSFKEAISNFMWNTQRDVKKGIQLFIKQFLEISQDSNSQRVVELARTLERSILEILATRPLDK